MVYLLISLLFSTHAQAAFFPVYSSKTLDGAGTSITSTGSALDVNIKSGQSTGSIFAGPTATPVPAQAAYVGGVDGTGKLQGMKVSSSGVLSVDASGVAVPVTGTFFQAIQPISATSLPLPTGAAPALQTTGNTSLSSIDSKTPALGTALAAASVPVVLPSLQVNSLQQIRALVAGTDSINDYLHDGSGNAISEGQQASAGSLPVVIASDQSSILVHEGVAGNSPGSSTVSTVATLTKPSNAIGFVLMNLDTSTANVRWRIGATATTSSGQQLQPGRDTGYVPCGANISIVAESGTQNYDVQWILSQ